jgi:hypothetical protein
VRRQWLGRDDTDLEELVGGLGRHHLDPLSRAEVSVDDPDVGDDTSVGVVDGVEDHRAGRRAGVALRWGELPDDLVQERLDPLPRLPRHPEAVLGLAADEPGELLGVLLRLRRCQVDLVEHRDDGELVLHGQVEVGQGLRLDALGRVDEQHRPFAGRQRPGHLVREVDMAGGVDHVEGVGLAADIPGHAHGLGLDGDASLPLDVHAVEVLGAHGTLVDHPGDLQHPVGQGRLPVVDVGDDAEVPDQVRRRRRGLQRGAGQG